MAQPGEITQLLQQADQGDRQAAEQLFPLVQDDLKAIARKRKRSAGAGADASTTLLVDDAFLRLVGQQATAWQAGDRRKFFGYTAKHIHELLVKGARAEGAAKRGGRHRRVEVSGDLAVKEEAGQLDVLLDLKEALDRLERFAPDDALGFRARYFLGCTFEELAALLAVSVTEAKRRFERARLWLENQLQEYKLDT